MKPRCCLQNSVSVINRPEALLLRLSDDWPEPPSPLGLMIKGVVMQERRRQMVSPVLNEVRKEGERSYYRNKVSTWLYTQGGACLLQENCSCTLCTCNPLDQPMSALQRPSRFTNRLLLKFQNTRTMLNRSQLSHSVFYCSILYLNFLQDINISS